jgi:hypothetical protein
LICFVHLGRTGLMDGLTEGEQNEVMTMVSLWTTGIVSNG